MLLLDTHAVVWLTANRAELSKSARSILRERADTLFVSSISALEIGLLVKRGRLLLPVEPEALFREAIRHHGIEEIPVDATILHASVRLPDLHNDPFDRILVATARLYRLSILSRDATLERYPGIVRVW